MEDLDASATEFEFRLAGFVIWSLQALDSDRVALGCNDGFIRVVSRVSKCIVQAVEHKAPGIADDAENTVNSLACDPFVESGDDTYVSAPILASASVTGFVHLWGRDSLVHDAEILSLEFTIASVSLSAKYVAAASFDNKVRLFARRGLGVYPCVRTVSVHKGPVACVYLCPHAPFVLSAGRDGLCYLTDVESGKQRWKADLRMFKNSLEIDPSDLLLLKDGRVAVTVLETRSIEPDVESVELRVWNAPQCVSPSSSSSKHFADSAAAGISMPTAREPSLQTSAPSDAAASKAAKWTRSRDSDGDGDMVIPAPLGVKVAAGNSAEPDSSGEEVRKRHRSSTAKEIDGVANTSTSDAPQATAGNSFHDKPVTIAVSAVKEPTVPRVPPGPSSRPAVEHVSSESLLKRWSERGLLRQDVVKMGRKHLASALAAFLLELDFERLVEFRVLERVLQGSFVLSNFSTSALSGRYSLSPQRFATLVKEGVEKWVKKEKFDVDVWSVYYDAAAANFLDEYYRAKY